MQIISISSVLSRVYAYINVVKIKTPVLDMGDWYASSASSI